MDLCIFNPWHDMALVYGRKPFTPPHIAVSMYEKMAWIAEQWRPAAKQHDSPSKLDSPLVAPSVDRRALTSDVELIRPWGWDHYTKRWLIKQGVPKEVMPTDEVLDQIRDLSNRKTFVPLLQELRSAFPNETVGEAVYVDSEEALLKAIEKFGDNVVLKAPWSSSGRGVTAFDVRRSTLDVHLLQWAKNIISRQGGLMVEPYYNKVRDMAVEFTSQKALDVGRLTLDVMGLSLFRNSNDGCGYEGNLLASEDRKRQMIGRYIDISLLDKVERKISEWMHDRLSAISSWKGLEELPFGVDMMIVSVDGEYKLHPCVEVNLRRTMGYVAIKLYENVINSKDLRLKYRIDENEKDFTGFFSVDAANGKCSVQVCEQGMVSGQW